MTRRELQQLILFKQDGTTHLGRELCAFANGVKGGGRRAIPGQQSLFGDEGAK
jgi:hypothetical protein